MLRFQCVFYLSSMHPTSAVRSTCPRLYSNMCIRTLLHSLIKSHSRDVSDRDTYPTHACCGNLAVDPTTSVATDSSSHMVTGPWRLCTSCPVASLVDGRRCYSHTRTRWPVVAIVHAACRTSVDSMLETCLRGVVVAVCTYTGAWSDRKTEHSRVSRTTRHFRSLTMNGALLVVDCRTWLSLERGIRRRRDSLMGLRAYRYRRESWVCVEV
jgi:hypothetical protein